MLLRGLECYSKGCSEAKRHDYVLPFYILVVTSELTGGDSGSSTMGFEDGGCTEITCRDSGSMMDST